jgi:ribosome-associated toxin RatA of RatAB toxin-antitoxin module
MATVRKSALVSYSAAQMFELVDAVKDYPQFLPWCRTATEKERSEQQVEATVVMAKGALHKSFTTRNLRYPNERIELQLVDGPFRRLEGTWTFQALDEQACKVSLTLDFEFSSKLVKLAIGPVFHHIADTMVDSFCQRAVQLYGH